MRIISTVRVRLAVDIEIDGTSRSKLTLDKINDETVSIASKRLDELLSGNSDIKRVPGHLQVTLVSHDMKKESE